MSGETQIPKKDRTDFMKAWKAKAQEVAYTGLCGLGPLEFVDPDTKQHFTFEVRIAIMPYDPEPGNEGAAIDTWPK